MSVEAKKIELEVEETPTVEEAKGVTTETTIETTSEGLVDLKPRITVIGVGGAGGNAVSNMIKLNLEGVDFIVANTDAQALTTSKAKDRVQLGLNITQGLGAGSRPDIGRAAAEESLDSIIKRIEGSHMVFITAGMGGGTGTGAAPVIARAAREKGILTVGVVTKPFHFEGSQRMRTAERGIEELQQFVDTLIIIPNQNLFRIANDRTTFADAFSMADDVLYSGVRGVTDLMIMPGLINLDFADIRSVMSEMGKAMMGTGEAEGEGRAISAAEAAISNPLLDDVSMKGARGVLINITGGPDMTLFEVDEAANRIRDEVESEANIIFGSTFDESMSGVMRVSVVATGIDAATEHKTQAPKRQSFVADVQDLKIEEEENTLPEEDFESEVSLDSAETRTDKTETLTQATLPLDEEVEETSTEALSPEPFEEVEKEEKPKKKFSFFGRFTEALRQKDEEEETHEPPTFKHLEEEKAEEVDLGKTGADDGLDIPAFLRRKNK